VRDVRITQIYEGTNGIQALDLVARKIVASNGIMYQMFADEVQVFINENLGGEFSDKLQIALNNLSDLTQWILNASKNDVNEIGAASVEYLHVFGYTVYAYMWAKMAKVASLKEGDFYSAKISTARFYYDRILPRCDGLTASVKGGSKSLFALNEDQF
jgi:hypothetical protein